MATLIEQVRRITSTESDDYFSDDYVLKLLNRSKNHIIELAIDLERRLGSSFRFLDSLRVTQTVNFGSFSSFSSFYTTSTTIPSDMDDYISLEIGTLTLKEAKSLYEVNYANAIPSAQEGYFLIYGDSFEFFLDVNTYSSFVLRYIQNNTPIINTDSTISDLNTKAETAVVYYTAYLLALSDESIDENKFLNTFNQLFRDLQ